MKKLSTITFFFALSFSSLSSAVEITPAHGHINSPPSRVYLCSRAAGSLNQGCEQASYDMDGLEGGKGFPQAGPADGTIASGGQTQPRFMTLNEQTPTRWYKVDLRSGKNAFNWSLGTPHRTTSWQFFITKPDWNPSSPLARASFDLTPFCEQNDNGQLPQKTVTIECDVPSRSGYNVILGVWTIADTPNAFYQVIDVNMSGTTTPPIEIDLNINNGNNVSADEINAALAQADKVNIGLWNGHWASEIKLPQASQANKSKSVYIETDAQLNTTVFFNDSNTVLNQGSKITFTSNGNTWEK